MLVGEGFAVTGEKLVFVSQSEEDAINAVPN